MKKKILFMFKYSITDSYAWLELSTKVKLLSQTYMFKDQYKGKQN